MSVTIKAKKTLPNMPNNLVANVISKLQQGNQAGDILGETKLFLNDYNSGTLTDNAHTNDLRIISPRVLISIGGSSASNALSQSLSRLYNTMVGSAYDTTTFNKADLGKHEIIGEGFILALDMIDRYIDTYNVKEFINKGYDYMVKAQRFSYYHSGLLVDFADLVAKRNTLIPNMNKLLLPSSIPWLNRHRALFRHVYADDMHEKSQLIVPVPEVLYTTLTATNDIGENTSWRTGLRGTDIDIINFIDNLYTNLQNYVESAFFKDISPYLWRAMLQPNGPKVDKPVVFAERTDVLPNTSFDVIFDYDIIQLVRNADYIGIPWNYRGDSDLVIREDNNENLIQGRLEVATNYYHYAIGVSPLAVFYATGHTVSSSEHPDNVYPKDFAADTNIKAAYYPVSNNDKIMNGEDFPSSDDTIYHVLNASVVASPVNLGGLHNGVQEVISSGDIIFTDLGLYYYIDPTNLFVSDIHPCFAMVLIQPTGYVCQFSARVMRIQTGGYWANDAVYTLLESLNCCPLMSVFYVKSDGLMYTKLLYVDKDNIITLPLKAVTNAHKYIMFQAMELGSSTFDSSIGGSISNSNNKGSGKRRKGNKQRSKQEDKKSSDSPSSNKE